MKKTLFAAAVLAAFTFTSCSESNTENAETTTENHEGMAHGDMNQSEAPAGVVVETPDYTTVAEPFKTQVNELVSEYMKLKDALVSSDAEAAKTAANQVLTVAKAMPVATISDAEQKSYAEEKTEKVISSATNIAGAADLAAHRENLEQLSESVYAMAKAYGATDEKLYYQHCPMAMNDKGGYWLSSNEEIRNPYFGDKMMKCGSTEEVLN
ncbi:DUF3347 domain-containing protein [Pontibacter anaerobius]|uniref:DUF3347 domain-containing protein n=1 Tax=Pontibacter anaerobius TaxID=2993940 RepID=A0ABT3RHB6_9BACT|nr:DUF3347 domain-containing protein [Pontibacter anaerobius]MCX2741206.1 DUF3347 domain-containing protein [Pontibacter anaerobius]